MEEMGEMEAEDCQDPLAHEETKVTKENWDQLEFLVPRGLWEVKVNRVCLESLALLDPKGHGEPLEIKVIVGTLVCLDLKGYREPRVHLLEGQCTYAGGGPLVPLTRELI